MNNYTSAAEIRKEVNAFFNAFEDEVPVICSIDEFRYQIFHCDLFNKLRSRNYYSCLLVVNATWHISSFCNSSMQFHGQIDGLELFNLLKSNVKSTIDLLETTENLVKKYQNTDD